MGKEYTKEEIEKARVGLLAYTDMQNQFLLSLSEDQMMAFTYFLGRIAYMDDLERTKEIYTTIGVIQGMNLSENQEESLVEKYMNIDKSDSPEKEKHFGTYI